MTCATVRSCVLILVTLTASLLCAQTQETSPTEPATSSASPPPPQSPRQALIEMFFGEKLDHLDKHLTDAARKAFKQLDDGSNKNVLDEISMMGKQMKAGAGQGFYIVETGPVLISAEQPTGKERTDIEKTEVMVERDEMVGDEDQIELSLHMYKNGQREPLPVVPRLVFAMKTEGGIWRLNEINLSLRVPIGDEEFLKDLAKNLKEKQQESNETMAGFALQNIVRTENSYHASHPDQAFLCSLSELAKVEVEEDLGGEQRHYQAVGGELAGGKQNGYVYALSGCDARHFKAVAEPATPNAGKRAFCVDEDGHVKSSNDGKATTCLTKGEQAAPPYPAGNVVYQNQAVPQ